MKNDHRIISDPVAWARRVNPVWKVRSGLDHAAEEWFEYLAEQDPRRLLVCCTIAATLTRGAGYGGDPKPWFYGGLFSLASAEEAHRFLTHHHLTAAVIPALASEPESEHWLAGLGASSHELVIRLRSAIQQEVATRWQNPPP